MLEHSMTSFLKQAAVKLVEVLLNYDHSPMSYYGFDQDRGEMVHMGIFGRIKDAAAARQGTAIQMCATAESWREISKKRRGSLLLDNHKNKYEIHFDGDKPVTKPFPGPRVTL